MTGRALRAAAAASCTLVAALVAALAGCSSGGTAPDADSPLAGYLNEIYGEYDPTDASAGAHPEEIRAEELIAACMADLGFEYYPVTDKTSGSVHDEDARGTLEFAQEFGYGYTIEADGPGRGTSYWPVIETEMSGAEQRNYEYALSLSGDARQQYEEALWGWMAMGPEHRPAEDEPTPELYGCFWDSQNEAGRDTYVAEQFPRVLEAIDDVPTQVEDDPRIAEARTAWGSCMATEGYPDLTTPLDAENLVNDIVNEFWAASGSRVDLSGSATEFDALKAAIPDELAAVQEQEIAVAVADATCRDDVAYDRLYADVREEYEQMLVDTYREDLEAWVAAAQDARAGQDQ